MNNDQPKPKKSIFKTIFIGLLAVLLILFVLSKLFPLDYYKLGSESFEKKDYLESLRYYEKVEKSDKNYSDATKKIQELKKINELNISKTQKKNSEIKINEETKTLLKSNDSLKFIIEHNLDESDKYYKIEFSKIESKIVKNAFLRKKEQFGLTEKVDGIKLTVYYKMTNPYPIEMEVPIPDYYYTQSDNKGYNFETYSRGCSCYIDNSTELSYQGKSLPVSEFDPISGRKKILVFKPNETKELKVAFTDNMNKDLEIFNFYGFRNSSKPSSVKYYEGFAINIKSKNVIEKITSKL